MVKRRLPIWLYSDWNINMRMGTLEIKQRILVATTVPELVLFNHASRTSGGYLEWKIHSHGEGEVKRLRAGNKDERNQKAVSSTAEKGHIVQGRRGNK